jgi:type VI secretion system protein ImpA
LVAELSKGTNSLDNIVANMQQQADPQSAPDFVALAKALMRMRKVLAEHLATRVRTNSTSRETNVSEPAAPLGDNTTSVTVTDMGTQTGEIRSREEAIRAIDAAVLFFRKYEPSSPVPLLLERARRLVSKGFMEVLEDIAPDGLAQARIIGGIRGEAQ